MSGESISIFEDGFFEEKENLKLMIECLGRRNRELLEKQGELFKERDLLYDQLRELEG
jgi:hypothetical protein